MIQPLNVRAFLVSRCLVRPYVRTYVHKLHAIIINYIINIYVLQSQAQYTYTYITRTHTCTFAYHRPYYLLTFCLSACMYVCLKRRMNFRAHVHSLKILEGGRPTYCKACARRLGGFLDCTAPLLGGVPRLFLAVRHS